MPTLQKITPCLWYDGQAEEAARLYTSIFPDSEILAITRYSEVGTEVHGQPAGQVMTVELQIAGQRMTALNGGPLFKFTEAVSFMVECADQAEVDYYWERLGEGGDPAARQCGWLKDRFGLSWQVVPARLGAMLSSGDGEAIRRVTACFMDMQKIVIEDLEKAYRG